VTTVKGKYGGRKVREGTVVSDKMQKTVVVAVEEHITHPLYKKRVRRLRRFMAHDELEDARLGDRVRILEAAPVSKRKRWQMVEVLQRVDLPEVAAESIDLELLGEVKREEEPADEAQTPAVVAATEPSLEAEPPEQAATGPVMEAEEVSVEDAEPTQEETPIEEPAPEDFDETPGASAEEIAEVLGDDTAPDAEAEGEEKPE
jgi:small subunit ribosomal protein S17